MAQALKGALTSFLKSESMDVKSETFGLSATETLIKVLRNLSRYDEYNDTYLNNFNFFFSSRNAPTKNRATSPCWPRSQPQRERNVADVVARISSWFLEKL